MQAGGEGANLLGIAGGPFADIEMIPLRHATDLGQRVDLIAGSHGRLDRETGGGGDDHPAQCGDEYFFLCLVHSRFPRNVWMLRRQWHPGLEPALILAFRSRSSWARVPGDQFMSRWWT